MGLLEFYKFILKEYILIFIPFVIGLGVLIRAESRGGGYKKGPSGL